MVVNPKIIKKIQQLKEENYKINQIAKKLNMSPNTVRKYLRTTTDLTKEKDLDQRESEREKNIEQLNEEIILAGMKPLVDDQLWEIFDSLEPLSDSMSESLKHQILFLITTLENTDDLRTIEWIKEKYEKLKKKWDHIFQQLLEETKQEEIKIRDKYDRIYNKLKSKLVETLNDTNDLLTWPLTSEELSEIFRKTLPYGQDIYLIGSTGRFANILKDYSLSTGEARIISGWWQKKIYRKNKYL